LRDDPRAAPHDIDIEMPPHGRGKLDLIQIDLSVAAIEIAEQAMGVYRPAAPRGDLLPQGLNVKIGQHSDGHKIKG
jgi:hypothetical protein